ncbi:trehalose-phosphatase [Sphingobium sufflavum]|uniref:trehalose-phosphatase n=1 Tax=Sphingobium sufflavum TaxID=1129547 RepID=UPI001F294380|nr:trehalose-phosphatase [Sphingobium sufflavum]MCE7796666.1 trehalose-phosphatase [Sphingobium sufflavum]
MTTEAQATRLPPPEPVDVGRSSLLLDFDGTLVSLQDDPHAVVVDAGLAGLLTRLAARFDGRVAIVSGRSLADLDRLLGPVGRLLALSGSHGCEHRWEGVDARPVRPPTLEIAAARMERFASLHPGVLLERKSFGVGLHYRRAPEHEDAAIALAQGIAAETGLAYQPGNRMAEVRVPGSDKGVAVSLLMQHAPMAGTIPIFLGDDETDEPGLAAAVALGGMAVAVGTRRSASARHALADVEAVRGWLKELCL